MKRRKFAIGLALLTACYLTQFTVAVATRKTEPSGRVVTLSAADPLNLIGIILPGERIPAASRTWIHFRDGIPELTAEI